MGEPSDLIIRRKTILDKDRSGINLVLIVDNVKEPGEGKIDVSLL